jgi:hypothetical protein
MNNEVVNKLIELKKEYPNHDVKFLGNSAFLDEAYSFCELTADRVGLSFWEDYNDEIFTDKKSLEERLIDDCPYFPDSIEQARWLDTKLTELGTKEVILVWLE